MQDKVVGSSYRIDRRGSFRGGALTEMVIVGLMAGLVLVTLCGAKALLKLRSSTPDQVRWIGIEDGGIQDPDQDQSFAVGSGFSYAADEGFW
jgi:hypothetical protein